jgi:hypothetical protein
MSQRKKYMDAEMLYAAPGAFILFYWMDDNLVCARKLWQLCTVDRGEVTAYTTGLPPCAPHPGRSVRLAEIFGLVSTGVKFEIW